LENGSNPILLYDGVCGLCNRLVQFVLRHDRHGFFRFAALQSSLAGQILERNGRRANELDTFYVVVDPNRPSERLLDRSDAMAFVLTELGGIWRALALTWKIFPRLLRDAIYNLVAANRYQWFGKLPACPIPGQSERERFLDVEEDVARKPFNHPTREI
jgi:predicted DCC family thiol-disulfide oxidoreductase YuxK